MGLRKITDTVDTGKVIWEFSEADSTSSDSAQVMQISAKTRELTAIFSISPQPMTSKVFIPFLRRIRKGNRKHRGFRRSDDSAAKPSFGLSPPASTTK